MNALTLEIVFQTLSWVEGGEVNCQVPPCCTNDATVLIQLFSEKTFPQFYGSFKFLWICEHSTISQTCNIENRTCNWSIIPDTAN